MDNNKKFRFSEFVEEVFHLPSTAEIETTAAVAYKCQGGRGGGNPVICGLQDREARIVPFSVFGTGDSRYMVIDAEIWKTRRDLHGFGMFEFAVNLYHSSVVAGRRLRR